MEKKKEGKEQYATDDPTDTTAQEQEDMVKEAIKKFWLLGEFLDLGTGVNNKKLDKDLKERQKLLEAYRVEIGSLKKKLQKLYHCSHYLKKVKIMLRDQIYSN